MNRGWWSLAALGLFAGGCRLTDSPAPSPTAASADLPTDRELWRLSRDLAVVEAGRAAFSSSSCRTCHGFYLTGGAAPNLMDQGWLHGGTPREVFGTITRGVPSKGMPTWGVVLGPKVITTLVAYIFSFHQEGEPIEAQASFTPFIPRYDPP